VLRGGALAAAGAFGGSLVVAGAIEGMHEIDTASDASSKLIATGETLYDFNQSWLFGGGYIAGSTDPDFDDSGYETVTLPHTVVPLSWNDWDPVAWEGLWIYRKHFDGDTVTGGRVLLTFDGIMTNATAVLNGRAIGSHVGGYLPWTLELTDAVTAGDNVLAIVVDSSWLDVPPAAPPLGPGSIDYLQPGGIYRGATLYIKPDAYISDLFAKPEHVLDPAARRVTTEITVDAAAVPKASRRDATITITLNDDSASLGSTTVHVDFAASQVKTFTVTLTGLRDIELWSPESPKLYELVATLRYGASGLHTVTKQIGFRSAVFTTDGFYLNGTKRVLFGLNRHQMFPYTGMAAATRLQRRDAQILRDELNCTIVRCSHYPQSPDFLDACDELGLMVFEETPGWHWVGDASFQDIVLDNVRDMVLRDRSRPSVVIWGSRLNETANYPGLYRKTRSIADELDGSRPSTGTMTTQSTAGWAEDVFSYDDYAATDELPVLFTPVPGVPYLVSEAVGAMLPRYSWTDPPDVLAQQAVAHAVVHSTAGSKPRYAGAVCWAGLDYWSAAENDKNWNSVRTPGVLDVFRVPKPGAAIYQSQVSPDRGVVIVPAFCWPEGAGVDRMIATNCDRLEIYLDKRQHAIVRPDRERFSGLAYPPAFVDLPAGQAELRIYGYLGDRLAATLSMSAETSADTLELTVDDDQITGDGSDATRITFRATDAYGNHRAGVTGDVTLSISGPGTLICQNPFSFAEFGGVGGGFVRSLPSQTGTITVTAAHPYLGQATVTVTVTPVVSYNYL
jgi:beta-galactosidase